MLVYQITNKIDGKRYIGQTTKSLEDRWKDHIAVRKNPSCRYLYSAIQKHGAENFEVKTLIIVGTKWEMDLYETGLIKAYNTKAPNGYNLTDGGDGAQGFVFTDEQRKKISDGLMGRKMSNIARQKLLERNKGNKFSEGIKMSEEHKLKLIAINKGRKHTEEELQKMAAARMTEVNGNHVRWHIKRNIINPNCKFCKEINDSKSTAS